MEEVNGMEMEEVQGSGMEGVQEMERVTGEVLGLGSGAEV
jgi:hypothetical protein